MAGYYGSDSSNPRYGIWKLEIVNLDLWSAPQTCHFQLKNSILRLGVTLHFIRSLTEEHAQYYSRS